MRFIRLIKDPEVIERILRHLDQWDPPRGKAAAPTPCRHGPRIRATPHGPGSGFPIAGLRRSAEAERKGQREDSETHLSHRISIAKRRAGGGRSPRARDPP